MSKAVASARCGIVRDCSREDCIFKMLFRGYKNNPQNEMEKRKNAEIERVNGKGFYPNWTVRGHGEIVDLYCDSFKEKK